MEKKKIQLRKRILISSFCGIIAFIIGFVFSWNKFYSFGDSPEKIKQVEIAIEKELKNIGKEAIVLKNDAGKSRELIDDIGIVTWGKIDKITKSLTYTNERIAKAKALLRFNQNPMPMVDEETGISLEGYEGSLWEKRFQVSNQNWEINTLSLKILKSLGLAIASCIGSLVVAFLILSVIPWFWYFLLERLSEVSQAIRGK